MDGSSSCSFSFDDSLVDYTSMLNTEDKRKRLSEEVEDRDLKESMMLQKLYRHIQRQVHHVDNEKEVI